ncbi:MAG: MFS transporter [Candidatus Eremiobacteraeota bacterium]|nr:MFS transporter [Candidatus Eremiobacteraeota bacterium]
MIGAAVEQPEPEQGRSSRLTAEFWLCNLGNLLILTGSVMFVLLPAYWAQAGMARWEMGLTDGAFWLVSVFVQPWLGPRLDRDGRTRYLVGGSFLMGLAAAGYAFVPVAFAPMVALRLAHGLGFAMYLTSSWTWVADYAPPGRVGELFGVFGISGMISGAVGPALAEFVQQHYQYRGLFLVGASLIALGWLFVLGLKEHAPRSDQLEKLPHFFGLITTRAMRGTAIGALGFGVAVGSLFAFVAPLLQSLNVAGIGGLFACTTLASGASRVFAGRQTDQLGPHRLIVPALVSLAVGSYGLGQLGASGDLMVVVLVGSGLSAGLGYGVIYPALNSLALRRLAPAARGRGLSVVTAAIDAGSTAGAALCGLMAHHFGYPRAFTSVALLVAFFAFAFWGSERTQHDGLDVVRRKDR